MNWNLVGWVAGVLLTFMGIKFVFVAIHTLCSKDAMKKAIGVVGASAENEAKKFGEHISKSIDKYKERRAEREMRKQEERKPEIIIR